MLAVSSLSAVFSSLSSGFTVVWFSAMLGCVQVLTDLCSSCHDLNTDIVHTLLTSPRSQRLHHTFWGPSHSDKGHAPISLPARRSFPRLDLLFPVKMCKKPTLAPSPRPRRVSKQASWLDSCYRITTTAEFLSGETFSCELSKEEEEEEAVAL
jgi:hypothetical protein